MGDTFKKKNEVQKRVKIIKHVYGENRGIFNMNTRGMLKNI